MSLSPDAAETLGLQALTWLIGNEDLLPVFLGATGASEDDLREQAQNPEFLGSVLDFLMMNDAWVIAFCDVYSIRYDHPKLARAALPGGGAGSLDLNSADVLSAALGMCLFRCTKYGFLCARTKTRFATIWRQMALQWKFVPHSFRLALTLPQFARMIPGNRTAKCSLMALSFCALRGAGMTQGI